MESLIARFEGGPLVHWENREGILALALTFIGLTRTQREWNTGSKESANSYYHSKGDFNVRRLGPSTLSLRNANDW